MTAALETLKELFLELDFTPTPGQIEEFERDLLVVSPSLMKAALKEVKASGQLRTHHCREARHVIFSVYHRKLAEQAALFPVFHALETALRSTLAVVLEDVYQRTDWWKPVEAALRDGKAPAAIGRLKQANGHMMSADAHSALCNLLTTVLSRKTGEQLLDGAVDGYALLSLSQLHHVQKLAVEHWGGFARYFSPNRPGRAPVTRTMFDQQMTKLRSVRNDVYHHNNTKGLMWVPKQADDLLDRLGVHLGHVLERVRQSATQPPLLSRPLEPGWHRTYSETVPAV